MPESQDTTSETNPQTKPMQRVGGSTQLDQQLNSLRRRLIREASQAVDLLSRSIEVLWTADRE
ncbi:MAG: hypothetical protein JKX70_00410, partial [Phycisphaerales bacterium]|nr:hypothetical protein [Phycisphaerales bacterium]